MLSKYFKLKHLVITLTAAATTLALLTTYSFSSKKDLKVSNNLVLGTKLNKKQKFTKGNSHFNRALKMNALENVTFSFEGQVVTFDCELFEVAQRYYLPLDKIVSVLGGYFYENSNIINIYYNNTKYALDKNVYSVKIEDKSPLQLRGDIISKNNRTYLSLSDIENIFNLVDDWDYYSRHISLFKSREIVNPPAANPSGIAALIRLEDVAAGEIMLKSDSLKKMKILADYFYSQGAKFNVAWIPRYKEPLNSIDNDLLETLSIENAQFVNMLDYLIIKGGVIGLHGYTHQYGDEASVSGTELSQECNNSIESTTKVIQAALYTADQLNIPIAFFETPHYAATELQQSVIENYFDYIYEPCVGLWNKTPAVSPRNKSTIYVPTPLGYIPESTGDALVNKIKNRPTGLLASFFYHPAKEFKYIQLYEDTDGYINYTYSEESPMHQVVKTLKDKGYKTINVNEIK